MEIPYSTGIPPFLSVIAGERTVSKRAGHAAPFEAVPLSRIREAAWRGESPARLTQIAGFYSTVWTVSSVQALLAVSAVLI